MRPGRFWPRKEFIGERMEERLPACFNEAGAFLAPEMCGRRAIASAASGASMRPGRFWPRKLQDKIVKRILQRPGFNEAGAFLAPERNVPKLTVVKD